MSNKLSESRLAEWRSLCKGWLNGLTCEPPEFKTEDFALLLDHITALAEELKAAQGGLEYVKGMNRHLSNNDAAKAVERFQAELVEAVRASGDWFKQADVIKLIQSFEANHE